MSNGWIQFYIRDSASKMFIFLSIYQYSIGYVVHIGIYRHSNVCNTNHKIITFEEHVIERKSTYFNENM